MTNTLPIIPAGIIRGWHGQGHIWRASDAGLCRREAGQQQLPRGQGTGLSAEYSQNGRSWIGRTFHQSTQVGNYIYIQMMCMHILRALCHFAEHSSIY